MRTCDRARGIDVAGDRHDEIRRGRPHEWPVRVFMPAAHVPRDVLESLRNGREMSAVKLAAERLAMGIQLGDDRPAADAELSHGERQTIAIRLAVTPLSRGEEARSADVGVAVLHVGESALRDAAADDDRNFVHGLDLEAHALGAVADCRHLGGGDVGLGANDASELREPRRRSIADRRARGETRGSGSRASSRIGRARVA